MENPGADKWMEENFMHTAIYGRDRKLMLMAKCKKCNSVLSDSKIAKLAHWNRLCISKYQFNFNNVNKFGEKLFIICSVCHKKFNTMTTAFMKNHHINCNAQQMVAPKSPIQPIVSATGSNINCVDKQMPSLSTDPNGSALSTLTQNVETTIQPTVIIAPLNPKVNVVTVNLDEFQFNMKTLRRVPDNKKIQCAECRICKKHFSMELILQHRIKCKIVEESPEPVEQEPEILISVQTVHTEIVNAQKNVACVTENNITPSGTKNTTNKSGPDCPPPEPISDGIVNSKRTVSKTNSRSIPKCFICESSNSNSFTNLYGTVSAYTTTSIYNFIWKWLGGKPSVRNEKTDAASLKQEVICSECLDTINNYDAALVTAKQFKKQICDKLTKTEANFERVQNEGNIKVINSVTNGVSVEDNVHHYSIIMDDTDTDTETDTNGNLPEASQAGTSQICLAQEFDVIDLCDDD